MKVAQAITETRAIIDDGCNRRGWKFSDAATVACVGTAVLRKKCSEPDLFRMRELNRLKDAKIITQDGYNSILAEACRWKP